jgi:hypothetical protein
MDLFLHHFRFHLEPRAPLHMPAYNKDNVIRGGFGSTFRRIVCHADYQVRFPLHSGHDSGPIPATHSGVKQPPFRSIPATPSGGLKSTV